MLRGELLQALGDLKRYRDELRGEVKALEQRYNDLKDAYDPRILDLRHQADSLASSFRVKFAEARAAYDNDEKALAKALSLEGKELQAECERLNQEKDQLIAQLKSALADLKTLRATLVRNNQALEGVRERLRTARSTRVEGFEDGDVFDSLKIEQVMDKLPQIIDGDGTLLRDFELDPSRDYQPRDLG
jgi:chromosome segregation ATPase